jgi:hypothetical protein
MADDLNVSPGSGATIRMVEKNSKKAQTVTIDLGGAGTEDLLTGSLPVTNPQITVDSNFSGQIYISSSTVNISGSTLNVSNRNGFLFKGNPANAGVVWFVNTGGQISGSMASGFPLSSSELSIFSGSNLNMLDYGVTGATSGCLCWTKL